MDKFKISILLFCLLTVIVTGCGREEAKAVSADGSADSEIVQDSSFSGRAEASETVKVVSKQAGKVFQINVDVGSAVDRKSVV